MDESKRNCINLPIQVIANCSTLGEFTPIRMRYEDPDNHQFHTLDIYEVLSSKERNFCGIKEIDYVCKVRLYDLMHLVEIRYQVVSHQWLLIRMLS